MINRIQSIKTSINHNPFRLQKPPLERLKYKGINQNQPYRPRVKFKFNLGPDRLCAHLKLFSSASKVLRKLILIFRQFHRERLR